MKSINGKFLKVTLLVLSILATACSKKVEVPKVDATDPGVAQTTLIEMIATSAEATKVVMDEEVEKGEAFKAAGFFFGNSGESEPQTASETPVAADEKGIRDGLKLIFADPQKKDGLIIYKPKSKDLCYAIHEGETTDPAQVETCISIMDKISFEQSVSGNASGSVIARFESIEIAKLDYTSASLELSLNLSVVVPGMRRIMQMAGSLLIFDETASGKLSIKVDKKSDAYVVLSLRALETVNLTGVDHGEPFKLYIAQSENLIVADVNRTEHVVKLGANIVEAQANFKVKNKLDELHPIAVNLSGISGEIIFDNAMKKVRFNMADANGKNALAVLVHEEVGFAVRYAQLQAELKTLSDGVARELSFEKLWQFSMSAKNSHYLPFEEAGENAEASAVYNFSEGTRIVRESMLNKIYKMNAGRLSGVGTGWMQGSIDVQSGQCFSSGNNPNGWQYLFHEVSCM